MRSPSITRQNFLAALGACIAAAPDDLQRQLFQTWESLGEESGFPGERPGELLAAICEMLDQELVSFRTVEDRQ